MSKDKNKRNIHFWFGEDDFSIMEELRRKKEEFAKEFGEANIFEIDWRYDGKNEREKISDLEVGLSSASLFSPDKMLILKSILAFSKKKQDENSEENASSGKDEKLLKYFSRPMEGIDLYIVESEVDQRKKIFKEIVKMEKEGLAEKKEFLLPIGRDFDKWICDRVEMYGGKIEREALNILSISLGKGFAQKDKSKKVIQSYNLWEADNEIYKIISFADGRDITTNDIELLVKSKVDMNIFNLMDNISQKDRKKSVSLLNSQIEKGANEIYILTMLTRQFRNLLVVKNLLEAGLSNLEIVKKTKMHPFVVKKTIDQSRNFSLTALRKIYGKLYDADVAIKTGKMDPALALDLLVVSIA